MKKERFRRSFLTIITILFLLLTTLRVDVLASNGQNENHWDIILKIEKLDETLNVIDYLIGTDTRQPEKSPTAMLKAMLQGTDWIDPKRSVVIAMQIQEPQPLVVVLVPFRKPNEIFQSMFNAASGPNYYTLTLPPGRTMTFSKDAEIFLLDKSSKQAKKSILLEIIVDRVLKKGGQQIREMLTNGQMVQPVPRENEQNLSSEEIQETVSNMLGLAAQMETFSIGLDLSPEIIAASVEIQAIEKTALANLFSPNTQNTLLNRYKPGYQMNYKMARFDITGMISLLDQVFGKMYQQMGINFRELTSIADHFTGETAGGMNYNVAGSSFESINVLKTTQNSPEFFETIFIPWLKSYSDSIRKILETQWGDKTSPIYHRTRNSMISGYNVVGVNIRLPLLPPTNGPVAGSTQKPDMISYEMRMTVVDNLLLIAPHDARLAELIQTGKSLKQEPLNGPMVWFEMDLDDYFNALKSMIPELSTSVPMPDMGKISYTADMKKGQFTAKSILKVQDIRTLIEYVKSGSDINSEISFEEK
jgi:hypothetical protein